MDTRNLRRKVEEEIDSYVYEAPSGMMGEPMPSEWIAAQLKEMRAALVEPTPRIVAISDSVAQTMGKVPPTMRECVLVADDHEGNEIYYDPKEENFVLAHAGDPPSTFNVRGDAVGCFLAR